VHGRDRERDDEQDCKTSMGTPRSAKSLVLITNAAGGRAAPERYSRKDQRTSNAPCARNKTKVLATVTQGRPAKAPRQGPTAAKAAAPKRAASPSNGRK
jgi:hypothetical protein